MSLNPHTQTYVRMLLHGDVEFLLQLHRWADSVRQLAALLRSIQRVRVHVLPHAADLWNTHTQEVENCSAVWPIRSWFCLEFVAEVSGTHRPSALKHLQQVKRSWWSSEGNKQLESNLTENWCFSAPSSDSFIMFRFSALEAPLFLCVLFCCSPFLCVWSKSDQTFRFYICNWFKGRVHIFPNITVRTSETWGDDDVLTWFHDLSLPCPL